MTITYLPTPAERKLIELAACHAVSDAVLQPAARWQDRAVNDLAAARVLLHLERGGEINQYGNGRWYAPPTSPLSGLSVSVVVNEMIRVGLLVHHVSGHLVPARVHHRVWLVGSERWASRCGVPGEHMGPKRVRLHADLQYVDCLACLDRL